MFLIPRTNSITNNCGQSSAQRIASVNSIKIWQLAFGINFLFFAALSSILAAQSCVMYAYFTDIRCDPYKGGIITNLNQLPPYFVFHAMKDVPGIGGIYMATIFSASLSTISSGINALATNTIEDLLIERLHNFQESTITLITKLVVSFYGILIIGLAYGTASLQGSITQMFVSISGAWGGPMFGIFLLGALFPVSNKYGVLGGSLMALLFTTWLVIENNFYGTHFSKPLLFPPTDMCFSNTSLNLIVNGSATHLLKKNQTFSLLDNSDNKTAGADKGFSINDISYQWFGFYGTVITLIMGSIISYCTRRWSISVVDEKLLFPFVRKLWRSQSLSRKEENNEDEKESMVKLQPYKQKEMM